MASNKDAGVPRSGGFAPRLSKAGPVVGAILALSTSLQLVGGWWIYPQESSRVYTIGTDNSHPYHYLNSDGVAEGMAAEVVAEAARRTHTRLEWRVTKEGTRALIGRTLDLWPLWGIDHRLVPNVHFTAPYLRNVYVGVSREPGLAIPEIRNTVRSVAVLGGPVPIALARKAFPKAIVIASRSREEALAVLCSSDVDVVMMETRPLQYQALERPRGCTGKPMHVFGLGMPSLPLAIASTPEAAAVADRLRAELDRMIEDGTLQRILRDWSYYYSGETEMLYRQEEANAAKRLANILAGVLSALLATLMILLYRVRAARQSAVAANIAKSLRIPAM